MGVCDIHRPPFYFGAERQTRGAEAPVDEGPLTFFFFFFTFSSVRPSATMINCQERVACQLASDLCALCPNHLLRGKGSCLSYYNGLQTHLCHGKGGSCHGAACCSQWLDISPARRPLAICVYPADSVRWKECYYCDGTLPQPLALRKVGRSLNDKSREEKLQKRSLHLIFAYELGLLRYSAASVTQAHSLV